MTAEIAILNKEAVALAADSAVTLAEGAKVYNSANKIFALSRYCPVGVMIWGTAELAETPWEIIIKLYRKKLFKKKYDLLNDYAADFFKFIESEEGLFPESQQEHFVKESIGLISNKIKEDIMASIYMRDRPPSESEVRDVISEIIKTYHDKWEKAPRDPHFSDEFVVEVENKYATVIEQAKKDVFEAIVEDPTLSSYLTKLALHALTRSHEQEMLPSSSGIVITGYGEKEIYPALRDFKVEAVLNNKIKYREYRSVAISHKNESTIIPFAQRDMVDAFMEGIMPKYRMAVSHRIVELCNGICNSIIETLKDLSDDAKEALRTKLEETKRTRLRECFNQLKYFQNKEYINPVVTAVGTLPKDELAAMAESLVYLTAFKKKVTMDKETVGGPIDVAVISKGEGFVWIKRKYYFKPELNPHFFSVHYMEGNNE